MERVEVKIDELREDINSNRDAMNLIEAIEDNECSLWLPNFEVTVQAVIMSPVKFEHEGEQYSFDGISLEKLKLEKALGINNDMVEE